MESPMSGSGVQTRFHHQKHTKKSDTREDPATAAPGVNSRPGSRQWTWFFCHDEMLPHIKITCVYRYGLFIVYRCKNNSVLSLAARSGDTLLSLSSADLRVLSHRLVIWWSRAPVRIRYQGSSCVVWTRHYREPMNSILPNQVAVHRKSLRWRSQAPMWHYCFHSLIVKNSSFVHVQYLHKDKWSGTL